MKKQHQSPEFMVINIDKQNAGFFAASGRPHFASPNFSGRMKSYDQQQDISSGELPMFGAAGYDTDNETFNW